MGRLSLIAVATLVLILDCSAKAEVPGKTSDWSCRISV